MNKLNLTKDNKRIASYVEDQLNKVVPADTHGIQIKLISNRGETKWIPLNKEYLPKVIAFMKTLGK
jgi:hypothetical protein